MTQQSLWSGLCGVLCLGLAALGAACDDTNKDSAPKKPAAVSAAGSDGGSDTDAGEKSADAETSAKAKRYLLGSITIDEDGKRTSYAQVVNELSGSFNNDEAVEVPGNAVFLAHGDDFFYGLEESPEWVRYSTRDGFKETGRLSFLDFGISYMDFANVIVDDETAVSVLTEAYVAVVWNPKTMQITGTIDLGDLKKDGYSIEAYTTTTRDGLVYVPGTWVNWKNTDVLQKVGMTVLDPKALSIVSRTEDDRCGAAGRVIFDDRGYAYVMGTGRNQSMQVFAEAKGKKSVPNCLLRIAPGETDFEKDFFYTIPELTDGLDSMTELETGDMNSGIGFTMMYYKDKLPDGLDLVNFEHWDQPAYKMWRIVLGDEPKAEEVQGADFSVVGFTGSAVDGKLYSGESGDGSETSVTEFDPKNNTATPKFTMKGYFAALLPLAN